MEKRNFVTSFRTSDAAKDCDDIIDAASQAFGGKMDKKASDFEKKASKEDEKSDSCL